MSRFRCADRIDGTAIDGQKRVLLLVDTEGLIQALQVLPASVQNRDTPAAIEPELAGSARLKVRADRAFTGEAAAAAPMVRRGGVDLELVGRKTKAGFDVEPKRWRIEQTFGVLGRYRRLLVDQEGSTTMACTMTLLAGLFMTGNRFERQIRAWVIDTAQSQAATHKGVVVWAGSGSGRSWPAAAALAARQAQAR